MTLINNISIGGYTLQNFHKIVWDENTGFITELCKDNKKVATIVDKGDGSDGIVDFASVLLGSKEEFHRFVLHDMEDLLSYLGAVTVEGSAYEGFRIDHYTAAYGFVKLLLDLNGIVNEYNEVVEKETSADYYIIGSLGRSWFTNESKDKEKTFFHSYTLTSDLTVANNFLLDYAEKHKEELGRLVAGAVLSGVMDWNLSFEDYAELYNP